MFARLFSQSGLSLDRLRALVEVGAHGSIVRAAEGGVARQSQFSRQLKELEDFFQVALVERHGRSVRLTPRGRELARISRFFLLGMSNFQRGCLAEAQTYRIAASATFAQTFLVPALAALNHRKGGIRFGVETADSGEIERRLHELTLDFGVVDKPSLSRPLQVQELGRARLNLWIPKALRLDARQARRAFQARKLPLAWPAKELPLSRFETLADLEPALTCETFLEARTLPKFAEPSGKVGERSRISSAPSRSFRESCLNVWASWFSNALVSCDVWSCSGQPSSGQPRQQIHGGGMAYKPKQKSEAVEQAKNRLSAMK